LFAVYQNIRIGVFEDKADLEIGDPIDVKAGVRIVGSHYAIDFGNRRIIGVNWFCRTSMKRREFHTYTIKRKVNT
jgi:hypothetical protein